MQHLPRGQRRSLLEIERRARAKGEWGQWEKLTFLPGSVGRSGWVAEIETCHKNQVFSVLSRDAGGGVRHLAIASLSGIRPTWWEAQRIKDELAGPEATAVEVYPPQAEIVDQADMYHLWVLPSALPFSLHHRTHNKEAA